MIHRATNVAADRNTAIIVATTNHVNTPTCRCPLRERSSSRLARARCAAGTSTFTIDRMVDGARAHVTEHEATVKRSLESA